MDEVDFSFVDLFACEDVIAAVEEIENDLEGKVWDGWIKLNYELANDVSLLGAADH